MKYLFSLFLIFIPVLGYAQTTNSLSQMLWNRVIGGCYSDDGVVKVDDSKNGYLAIVGGSGPCGCDCATKVGAYKNNSGEYIFLQFDEDHCGWFKAISSNKNLAEILPEGFGINNFISKPIPYKINHPIFFANFQVPHVGTDTKVKLELVPFGLKPRGKKLLCYEYGQGDGDDRVPNNCQDFYLIQEMAREIQDDKTLDYMVNGEHDKIAERDERASLKVPLLGQELVELYQIYKIYLSLDATEITLGWDKQNSRFFVKGKSGKPEHMTFKEFLLKNEFWGFRC